MFKPVFVIQKHKGAYSESCQTSKIGLFVKIIDDRRLLAIFAKSSIIDVFQGFEYASRVI